MATIGRHYFQVCIEGARARGIDVDAMLRSTGIDPAALDRLGWRGDVVAMAALVRGIWIALDDEHMGFTRHGLPHGAMAFAVEMAIEADSVGEGLARAMRFYNLASRDIATRMAEEGGEAIVTTVHADPQRDPRHYFGEFWLITWHRLACWLAGETVPLTGAEFDYPRPDAYFEEFKYLFPCAHRFDAPARLIRMDARPLHHPVRRTMADLEAMMAAAPLELMTIPASDHSLQRTVRSLLGHDQALSADAVAASLGLASDSLRRRLRQEGTSLSAIRENLRRDAATRALLGSNRSVEAIAAGLGYAESRSFTRAFRLWTGMSPSAYRRHHGVA